MSRNVVVLFHQIGVVRLEPLDDLALLAVGLNAVHRAVLRIFHQCLCKLATPGAMRVRCLHPLVALILIRMLHFLIR